MAIMAGLALAGIGLNLVGQMQQHQELKLQNILHRQELNQKSQVSRALFDLQFPNMKQQQRANRGQMATHAAKGGVATESVSVLALLSEQARVDSMNRSLAVFQQALDQQGFKFGKAQAKRETQASKTNLIFQALASGVQAASTANSAFSGSS